MTDNKGTTKVASVLLKDAGWIPEQVTSDLSVTLWRRPDTNALYGEGEAFAIVSRDLARAAEEEL